MELKIEEQAVFDLRELYRRYGYRMYRMSRFEEYDLYVRNKDFLISDQIVTFADRSGKLMALKPDVTLSIIKYTPQESGAVQKVYYNENVYRADSNTHILREIMQTGLECVGDLGDYEIAEVVLLAAKSLALLNKPFALDLSHMGLVSAVLKGLAGEVKQQIMDCLRQKNTHDLQKLIAREQIDGGTARKLTYLVTCRGNVEQILGELSDILDTEEEKTAFSQLAQLCKILADNGYGEQTKVDFSVGSDMKYYSGVVFKGYLSGIYGTVLSGGQYDKLLQSMGRRGGAVGFAVYVDLLRQNDQQQDNVDTLILRDKWADPAEVLAETEKAAAEGTVLVASQIPQERSWRKLVDLRKEQGR